MNEISKSQTVRAVDVLLIGPFLIYVGMQKKNSQNINMALIAIGALTILYNGNNFLKNLKK
jgi:hypothetical protein